LGVGRVEEGGAVSEAINIHDSYMAKLLEQAEDRAKGDNGSCVVSIQREGEALSKRRRYLAELGPRRREGRQP
jgi:hypothetical protein